MNIRLRSCAQNALNAALQLVSQASGIASGNLLREYMAESVGDFFEIEEEETINEDLLGEGQVDEVRAVLHQIEQVAADEHRNEAALDESEAPPHDADLELPDGLALVELTSHDPADTAAAKDPVLLDLFSRVNMCYHVLTCVNYCSSSVQLCSTSSNSWNYFPHTLVYKMDNLLVPPDSVCFKHWNLHELSIL